MAPGRVVISSEKPFIWTEQIEAARQEAWLRIYETVSRINTEIGQRNRSFLCSLGGLYALTAGWVWWVGGSLSQFLTLGTLFSLSLVAGCALAVTYCYFYHRRWIQQNALELGHATPLFLRPVRLPKRRYIFHLFNVALRSHEEYLDQLATPYTLLTNLTHELWYYELTYRVMGYRLLGFTGHENDGRLLYHLKYE